MKKKQNTEQELLRFTQHLLDDVRALEYMIDNDWFENNITRIGAEQEMVLVDNNTLKPVSLGPTILNEMKQYPWAGPEIAKFNIECNMSPQELTGSCFSKMEAETRMMLDLVQKHAKAHNADLILTGILPTLRKYDLSLINLSPYDRYKAILNALDRELKGRNGYELRLTGIDEILIRHDSPFLEACNNSFQVHLQVTPNNFVKLYNIAQVLAPCMIALSANSPIVFGKRLWHESRIALFQQALDTRSSHEHMRERMPRVSFGHDWLKKSILEIFKEDIARFRVLIPDQTTENATEFLKKGVTPKLKALMMHNSTVYRWNRACYGISENGKPHLRIENRVIPAGPTLLDQMANTAFWIGCMKGLEQEFDDITEKFDSFVDIRDNFAKAARFGIDSKFNWFGEDKISTTELICDELMPYAKKGLRSQGVDEKDIEKYLGVIHARMEKHSNGARWQLRAYTKLLKETEQDEALTCLTAAIRENQQSGKPGHEWPLPNLNDLLTYRPNHMKVSDFMTTDFTTVQPDDSITLAAELMDWKKDHYCLVEDAEGNYVGLLTSSVIMKNLLARDFFGKKTFVKEIMLPKTICVTPSSTILEAIQLIENQELACLPVVHGKELVGLITEYNFLRISQRLIKRGQLT